MLLSKVEKGAEFTYGVHSGYLASLVRDNQASIMIPSNATKVLRSLDNAVMGSVRKLNEDWGLFRQGIAYTLPFTRNEKGELVYLVYCRKKSNNEGQLALKLSLAPGGHIERDDVNYHVLDAGNGKATETPVIDFLAMLGSNLQRELGEEVKFTPSPAYWKPERDLAWYAASHAQPIGFVMDSQPKPGYVGNIHFGALYAAPLPGGTTFEMAEKHNHGLGWYTARELVAMATGGLELEEGTAQFEPWSKLVIAEIAKVEFVINNIWGQDAGHPTSGSEELARDGVETAEPTPAEMQIDLIIKEVKDRMASLGECAPDPLFEKLQALGVFQGPGEHEVALQKPQENMRFRVQVSQKHEAILITHLGPCAQSSGPVAVLVLEGLSKSAEYPAGLFEEVLEAVSFALIDGNKHRAKLAE